jgi:hypothetical protein
VQLVAKSPTNRVLSRKFHFLVNIKYNINICLGGVEMSVLSSAVDVWKANFGSSTIICFGSPADALNKFKG